MDTKVFNNDTDLVSVLRDLLYSDDPVKYISGLNPEYGVSFNENTNQIVVYNRITKQSVSMVI